MDNTATTTAELVEDAGLAVVDAGVVTAGFEELLGLIAAGRADVANVQDIATDVLPRLHALQTFLLEQVAQAWA